MCSSCVRTSKKDIPKSGVLACCGDLLTCFLPDKKAVLMKEWSFLHLWGWGYDYSVICLYHCAPLPYGVLQVKNPEDGNNIIHGTHCLKVQRPVLWENTVPNHFAEFTISWYIANASSNSLWSSRMAWFRSNVMTTIPDLWCVVVLCDQFFSGDDWTMRRKNIEDIFFEHYNKHQ